MKSRKIQKAKIKILTNVQIDNKIGNAKECHAEIEDIVTKALVKTID